MPFWKRKDTQGPENGDFAAYLERRAAGASSASPMSQSTRTTAKLPSESAPAQAPAPGTTLEGILVQGEEPTAEFLEEFAALEAAPEVSDDDLARQALADPGADDDPSTPE